MNTVFKNLSLAGQELALGLAAYTARPDTLVLGLPLGGVFIGCEIATALNLPLDVLVVRKVSVPGDQKLVIGALAQGGIQLIDEVLIARRGISMALVEQAVLHAEKELCYRERIYRGELPPTDVAGKTVILADVWFGATMQAAVLALHKSRAARIVAAAPVAARAAVEKLRALADEVVVVRALA
ncbi:MAG: phosphoribosyl transferase, partial [Candidatus Melainabacteria bacterium HGW-Melainabacteria-1]